jgi:hypothetical protein
MCYAFGLAGGLATAVRPGRNSLHPGEAFDAVAGTPGGQTFFFVAQGFRSGCLTGVCVPPGTWRLSGGLPGRPARW